MIDNKLNFSTHINDMCKKLNRISASFRVTLLMELPTTWLLMNAFFMSQSFSLDMPPKNNMVNGLCLDNALNNIHEWALQLIYSNHEKSFNSAVTKNNLKTIHKKILEFLAIEICKFQNSLSPTTMNDSNNIHVL